jgi:hypothetical protein
MLNPYDRQSKKVHSGRYSAVDREIFNIIDALEKIYNKLKKYFCKLPSNTEMLKLPECCLEEYDVQNLNKRVHELQEFHDDLEDCQLLAEAEECGVNILLTRNASFKQNLQHQANNVRILHPIYYAKEIVK